MTWNRKWLPWWFSVCLALFFLHQVAQKLVGYNITILDAYLDPFLASPIILHLYLLDRQLLFKSNREQLHPSEVVVVTVVLATMGELVFPYLSDRLHYDPYDFLAYALGALLYVLVRE